MDEIRNTWRPGVHARVRRLYGLEHAGEVGQVVLTAAEGGDLMVTVEFEDAQRYQYYTEELLRIGGY